MVDLATFRTFHRASPGRQSEALVAEPDLQLEKGGLTEEALPTRFTQELRARRRAARTDMRQSEAWAEADIVHAPTAPLATPVDPAPAPVDLAVEAQFEAEHAELPAPHIEHEDAVHAAPALEEQTVLHEEELAPPVLAESSEPDEVSVHEQTVAYEAAADLSPEPAVPAIGPEESQDEPSATDAAHDAPGADSTGWHGEPAPVEPAPMLPSRPVRIEELLGETIAPPEVPAPVITPHFASPPPVFETDEASLPDEEPALLLRQNYSSESLPLDYRLIGLANPLVCTVTGRLGDATPIELSIGRTGIYRPNGFRAAPWSGFAYDVSSDGRTGLALGTRILTSRGEIPVEDLVPGDSALALRGPALLPIVWIGRSIAVPPPVEIAADAFGPGRPSRTLRVGADHPVFMQTLPVAARDLVNGDTIRVIDTETAELFHIDVGFAEVLLAEGVPLASGCR